MKYKNFRLCLNASGRFLLKIYTISILCMLLICCTASCLSQIESKLVGVQTKLHNNLNRRFHRHHNHNHQTATNSNLNKTSNPFDSLKSENPIRYNKKRCRYSDHEINFNNQRNIMNKMNDMKNKNNYYNYANSDNADRDSNSLSYVKQPKVRDQQNRQDSNYAIEPHIETEKIYVDIGETINLTCYINTKEVDWHFKDKNLTTTIISNGLQLQIFQPILLDIDDLSQTNSKYNDDYDRQYQEMRYRVLRGTNGQILKYKVSSDQQFTHMLTLYVQGAQDEGSYQCIDSISESPIKKTIIVTLKNNSRALTSGLAGTRSSIHYLYMISILLCLIF